MKSRKNNKKHIGGIRYIDKPLFFATIVICIVGLIMVFSSSSIAAVLQYGQSEYFFFVKQLLFILTGFVISFVLTKIDTKISCACSLLYAGCVLIALFGLRIYGSVVNSARSWIMIGPISIQPSEFSKSAIILFLAFMYGTKRKWMKPVDVFVPLLLPVFICGVVALEPDLGTAAIIAIITMFIFFSLPVENNKLIKYTRITAIACVVIVIGFLATSNSLLTETQANRFNYHNPCSRYLDDTGFQVCNGYIAINNGGLFGVGLGNSTQKYLYLPEAHTDFIFPIIVEELGLVGGVAVIGLLVFILYRILAISRNACNLRGSVIAMGTFAYILTHILVNLGGALALIPLTGVPLPFMSYGGSFTWNLFILLGLTQRVAIETKEIKYKRELKKVVG